MDTEKKSSKTVLEEELLRRMNELKSMDPSSDAAKKQLEYVEALHKLKINEDTVEETKRANEAKEKAERIKARDNRILGIAELGVTLITFAVGLANRNRLFDKGLTFEKDGILTSKTFGELFKESLHTKN